MRPRSRSSASASSRPPRAGARCCPTPPRSSTPLGGTCSTRAWRCCSPSSPSTWSATRFRTPSTRRRDAGDLKEISSHRNRIEPKGRTMRRKPLKAVLPLLLVPLTLGLAACGGGGEEGGQTAADFPPPTAPPDDAKQGG